LEIKNFFTLSSRMDCHAATRNDAKGGREVGGA